MDQSTEYIYTKAMRAGQRIVREAEEKGKNPYLQALEELVPNLNQLSRVPLGIQTIRQDRIVGTMAAGRTPAFSYDFKPLLGVATEFAAKWRSLYESVSENGVREAIKVLEYMNRYYAIEGNKRISVMRELGGDYMEADVTRVLPKRTEDKENKIYFEFLDFYADTKLSDIYFSEEGSFGAFIELSRHTPGEKWPEDDVKALRSAFYRFSGILSKMEQRSGKVTDGDVLLLYLKVFGYDGFLKATDTELQNHLTRMRSEVTAMSQDVSIALKMSAEGQAPNLLRQILRGTPQLKVCFINNRNPEISGWTYWHALGKNHVDSTFTKGVTTQMINDVNAADCQHVIEDAVKDGANVVFTTSPVLLDGAMKAAVNLPEAKILNCSLLPEYHAVRSYYLRMYEAKFILGAIAGVVCDNNRIGYITDYPVYGIPASVNAFALGARMTNPRAKVYLEWSTIVGHDPDAALAEQDVQVICNRDIAAPAFESTVFGLYENKEGKPQNLAMPVWQWGKLYEDLIRRIQNGVWDNDTTERDAQALNYWWGMDAGAIDVFYSKKLDAGTRRLIEVLRKDLINGTLKPFSDQIISQDG